MNISHTEIRIAVRSLELLFYNYKLEDVQALMPLPDFSYLWDKYVIGESNTYRGFWDVCDKAPVETKDAIISRALLRYRDEAAESFG